MAKNRKRVSLDEMIGTLGLPRTAEPVSPGAKLFQQIAQYRMTMAARKARKERRK